MKTKVINLIQSFLYIPQKKQQKFQGVETELILTTNRIKEIKVYAVDTNGNRIPEDSECNPLPYLPISTIVPKESTITRILKESRAFTKELPGASSNAIHR